MYLWSQRVRVWRRRCAWTHYEFGKGAAFQPNRRRSRISGGLSPWARITAIILGGLAIPLLAPPQGVYTLCVLLADEHGDQYRYLAGQT